MRRPRPRVLILCGLLAAVALAYASFPGRRLPLAFTIGTGIGTASLQKRIDRLEQLAINRGEFSSEDRAFLRDFYATLATGAKLTIVVRQTGHLMDHYLEGSGSDFALEPRIFRDNAKVRAQLALLKKRAASAPCDSGTRFSSPSFHMPDTSQIDSVFGLYYGALHVTRVSLTSGGCGFHVHAEVPWTWPSYASLQRKYGSYHAESFPLPNLAVWLFGMRRALYVDNGLGEYLAELGLARPFLAFAEWDES